MTRWPIIPTLLVGLAIATMIALGLWQLLDRLPQKEAFLAQLAANPAKPAIAFPDSSDQSLLFRKASAVCDAPIAIERVGAGAAGYRLIAKCRADAANPDPIVQLGTTRRPDAETGWRGGRVDGHVALAPDGRSLIGSLFDPTPQRLMLVAATPPPGLNANRPPDLDSVPNNHLAYAVQWFLFAGIAGIIYFLALRRRQG